MYIMNAYKIVWKNIPTYMEEIRKRDFYFMHIKKHVIFYYQL